MPIRIMGCGCVCLISGDLIIGAPIRMCARHTDELELKAFREGLAWVCAAYPSRCGTTYWVKKQMRYEGLVQVKATSPTQALAVARDATTETAEWVEDYPVSTWSVDDAEGRTLIEGDPA